MDKETAAHAKARMCRHLRELDQEFQTSSASPLHHDNRCGDNGHH